MGYTYRGNRTGPDLFDEPPTTYHYTSPYETQERQERSALFAYWYARGHNDEEIAATTGYESHAVQRWRNTRGLRSNHEMTKTA